MERVKIDYLYRFYKPDNEDNLKDLNDGKLFISDPQEFNDPFEGIYGNERTLYEKIVDPYFKKDGRKPTIKYIVDTMIISANQGYEFGAKKLSNRMFESYYRMIENNFDKDLPQYKEEVLNLVSEMRKKYLENNYRVACFSGLKDNRSLYNRIDMWAYYSSNHKGYCVKYDLRGCSDHILDNLYKVQYRRKNWKRPVEGQYDDYLKLLFTRKKMIWEHEQEYRLILKDCSKIDFPYAKDIFVGYLADRSLKDKLESIARKIDANYYEMTADYWSKSFTYM